MENKITTNQKFKRNELREIILAALGIGGVLIGSAFITLNFPIVVGLLLKLIEEIKGIKPPRYKVNRVLKQLEKKQIIELEIKGKEVYVKVKEKNNIEIIKYSIKSLLELKKKKKWNGKWFLVVFDVPEKERKKRDYLRMFLKQIGFYPYQQSVYVFPYECEREISLVKKIVEGGEYISYLVAEKLEREEEVKIYFGLN